MSPESFAMRLAHSLDREETPAARNVASKN